MRKLPKKYGDGQKSLQYKKKYITFEIYELLNCSLQSNQRY